MKSVLLGWLLGVGLLVNHVGCCSVQLVGDGCETGACGGLGGCEGLHAHGGLRSRIANHIRNTNCGSGCGEIYWDEHINEPPVCDPCGCNGEFECGSCGSCPTAFGRLRNLWGYRYVPSNCGECNSCGIASSGHVSGGCSTCAGNTHAEYSTDAHSNVSSHATMTQPTSRMAPSTDGATSNRVPTPASKPKPQRAPSVAPTPVPDSNAMYRDEATPLERLVIGSGVETSSRKAVARPVAASASQSIQGKPRLVTNPR